MKVRINKRTLIFFSFAAITIGNSSYLKAVGYNSIIEYIGYGILLLGIYYYVRESKLIQKKQIRYSYWLSVIIFFSIGILFQNLPALIKIRLLLTMAVIFSVSVMAEGYMQSLLDIKTASYGILFGILVSFIIAISTNTSVTSKSVEGISKIGFTGGLQHKNYFAADLVACFAGIFIYNKYMKKNRFDILVMIILVALILSTNSRGGYIFLLIFLLLSNYDKLKLIKKNQRKWMITILLFFAVIFALNFYDIITGISSSYYIRTNGLRNYIRFYKKDTFHMLLGDAEMAFKNPEISYNDSIRAVVGWDGTVELAFLSVLVKNGLLGFLGYFLVFAHMLKRALRSDDWMCKTVIVSSVVLLIVSSFVETYMVNIHIVFGTFFYMISVGLCGQKNNFSRNSRKNT